MPKDNIERAVKRGTGELEGAALEEIRYEGYGPAGVAVIVETLTDNRNRTVGEVRYMFSKYGGNLGASGCVAYLFDKKGVLSFDLDGVDGDALLEAALEAGADDAVESETSIDVITSPVDFERVKASLADGGFSPAVAEITMQPSTMVKLEGKQAASMLAVSDALEDLDDVQNVHANFDISEEEMGRLAE